jgi:hypothetical protein
MESQRADELEKKHNAVLAEVKSFRDGPSKREQAVAAVDGMMAMFRGGEPQQPQQAAEGDSEDMKAAVEAANMAKTALNSALVDTVPNMTFFQYCSGHEGHSPLLSL